MNQSELNEAYSNAVKSHKENPTDESLAEVLRTARAASPWLNDEVEEGIYEADTFRDHDPVEQIYHDYEVWDRHHR